MAIRFDKDTRRATNGPMIFFSDPSAEISLGEEIRGAINSRLSMYAYRRPGDMMISFGSSECVVEGIGEPGFVIAPFLPSLPYLTIPYKPSHINSKPSTLDTNLSTLNSQLTSTTQSQHETEVVAIREALTKAGGGKVVAARVIVKEERTDPAEIFSNLCLKYPNAFVFCFSTPITGCWIGASPELLLEAHANTLRTMSLAGTRPAGSQEPWDSKNINEQQMVTDFITDTFEKNSLKPAEGTTFTKQAGAVEHICTPISADINPSCFNPEMLNRLLRDLSPTPALCGLPRDLAFSLINKYEGFSRGCYGGFCGPFHNACNFTFFVNLRSASIEAERLTLFVGGGITRQSDPLSEWRETELKARTVLEALS